MPRLTASIVIGMFLLFGGAPVFAGPDRGTVIDDPRYVVYLPPEMNSGDKYPAVFALGPDANARAAADLWVPVVQSRGWIIVASKECRNDLTFTELMPKLELVIKDVLSKHPIDRTQVLVAGYAGGAMAAHALIFAHPDWFAGLVVNTGMIHPSYTQQIAAYPKGKLAVFLASPTDYRYDEMQNDRQFLENLEWKTEWIDFEGGHMPAPVAAYEQAARWLDQRLPRPVVPRAEGGVSPGTQPMPADDAAKDSSLGALQDQDKGDNE